MFALVTFNDQSSLADAASTLDQLEFVLVSADFSVEHSGVSSDSSGVSAVMLISSTPKRSSHIPIDRCSFTARVYKLVNSSSDKLFTVETYCTKDEAMSSLVGINISKSYLKINESGQLEHIFLADRFEVHELASIRDVITLAGSEIFVSDARLASLFSEQKSFSIDNGRILVIPFSTSSAYCFEVLHYDSTN